MTSQAAAEGRLAGVRGIVFLGFPLHPAGKPGTARADHLASGQHHLGEAVRLLERAASLGSRRQSARIWRNLADARYELKDFPRAIVAYRTAIEKKRVRLDGVSVPYQQVTVEDLAAGRVAAADARFLGDAFHRLGRSHAAAGEPGEAVGKFRQAALWLPENGELQYRAGLALVEARELREALLFLRRAAEILTGPDGASAREAVAAAVKDLRDQADQWFERGTRAEANAGGQREALQAYEQAILLRPNFVRARLRAARLEAEWKGNYRGAEEHLRAALASLDDEASESGNLDDVARLRAEVAAIQEEVDALRAKGDDGG
jgi:tetratricopeptide (TPR) repeat protein